MQVVIFDTFGISELQSRKASLVHICCASGLNARLADGSAKKETAIAEIMTVKRVGPLIIFGFPQVVTTRSDACFVSARFRRNRKMVSFHLEP
jgi:hypothetical protein